jgi:hypothetical protein
MLADAADGRAAPRACGLKAPEEFCEFWLRRALSAASSASSVTMRCSYPSITTHSAAWTSGGIRSQRSVGSGNSLSLTLLHISQSRLFLKVCPLNAYAGYKSEIYIMMPTARLLGRTIAAAIAVCLLTGDADSARATTSGAVTFVVTRPVSCSFRFG